jgi:outer membrane protein OmpA-like peptidoglycan-associated protein
MKEGVAQMKKFAGFIILTAITLSMVACGTGTFKKMEVASVLNNPSDEVNQLNSLLSAARNDQVNVLSPTLFSQAEMYYKEAKTALDEGNEISSILEKITYGRVRLEKAEEMARLSRTVLPEVIKARDAARTVNAPSLGEEYDNVENDFLALTKAVENDNLRWAQNNSKEVLNTYDRLELKVIKKNMLDEIKALIRKAEKADAKKKVPQIFDLTVKKYKEADAFISEHRYNKDEMHKKTNASLFQAQRLHQILQQANTLQTMTPEKNAIWIEELLYTIANELSAQDMRNADFNTQVKNIVASIKTLQADHQFVIDKNKTLQNQIKDMEQQIAVLDGLSKKERSQKERLAAEKHFNQLFQEVQSLFKEEEAEVYKQQNRLVIRLRGIRFPVGQEVIMPENYALLSKVQRAIRTFGEPDLVIEGHTDSTGTSTSNDHLSQQRAEAVKEYFSANRTLPRDKIVAVGYGSKRPLASNETSEGRAINRRIDVIISPLEK